MEPPVLVLYQGMSGHCNLIGWAVFRAYVLSTLLVTQLQLTNGREFALGAVLQVPDSWASALASLLHTAMVAIGLVLVIKSEESVSSNDFPTQ